jgi:hypothetical protein
VLAHPAAAITLEDVWCAVNGGAERPLLALRTPAGRSEGCVRALVVLASAFGEAEVVFRARLRRVTPRHLAERLAQR